MIVAPELFDILCGKGKPIQKHPGNVLLRLLIDQNSHRYNKAPRLKRRAIANEIVQGLKSNTGKLPGRFLRFCDESAEEQEGWTEVSNAEAIDKVSHCFRARRNLAPGMSSSFSGVSLVSMTSTSSSVVVSDDDIACGFTAPTRTMTDHNHMDADRHHQEQLSTCIVSPQVPMPGRGSNAWWWSMTEEQRQDASSFYQSIRGVGTSNKPPFTSFVVDAGPQQSATISSGGSLTHLYEHQEEQERNKPPWGASEFY